VVRVHGPPREHPPPHVHVGLGKEELVVIRLGSISSAPTVWAVYGMKHQHVLKAFGIVVKHHALIEQAWRTMHGQMGGE